MSNGMTPIPEIFLVRIIVIVLWPKADLRKTHKQSSVDIGKARIIQMKNIWGNMQPFQIFLILF